MEKSIGPIEKLLIPYSMPTEYSKVQQKILFAFLADKYLRWAQHPSRQKNMIREAIETHAIHNPISKQVLNEETTYNQARRDIVGGYDYESGSVSIKSIVLAHISPWHRKDLENLEACLGVLGRTGNPFVDPCLHAVDVGIQVIGNWGVDEPDQNFQKYVRTDGKSKPWLRNHVILSLNNLQERAVYLDALVADAFDRPMEPLAFKYKPL